MRKSICVIVFSLMALSIYGRQQSVRQPWQTPPSGTFLGSIEFPKSTTKIPAISAYYKGTKVSIADGSYSFKEADDANELYVLCTLEQIIPESTDTDPNTIQHFRLVVPQTPSASETSATNDSSTPNKKHRKRLHYKLFKLTKTTTQSPQGCWEINRAKLALDTSNKNKSFLKIPENTLIILVNPCYVQSLEAEPWDARRNTCKLPRLVFKPTVSEKNIDDMSVKGLLASLDLDPFHKKPNIIKEQKPENAQVIVSMITD